MDNLENAALVNVELGRKLGGVHLPSFAIGLVEDVLIVASEGRLLASLNKSLNIFILEVVARKIEESSKRFTLIHRQISEGNDRSSAYLASELSSFL